MEKLKNQSHGQTELTHRIRLAKDERVGGAFLAPPEGNTRGTNSRARLYCTIAIRIALIRSRVSYRHVRVLSNVRDAQIMRL